MLPHRISAVSAILLICTASFAAQEKAKIVLKAEEGSVARYENKLNLEMAAAGQTMKMTMNQVDKVTYGATNAKGEITYTEETESSSQEFDGEKVEDTDKEEPSKYTIAANGLLVGFVPGNKDEEMDKINCRLHVATSVIFSDKPVGPGDSWTYDVKADAKLGLVAGKGSYKLIGYEQKNDVDCAKIEATYTENGSGISSKGTFWIDRASGDNVYSDIEVKNVPFGEGADKSIGSAKGTEQRISGGPLKADAERKVASKGIDDKVKDFEKIAGIFTLYRQQKEGRDTIYMEIKEDQMNKLVMLQATTGTGNYDNLVEGDPLRDYYFKIVKLPSDRIGFYVPNYTQRADSGTPIERAVKRSFSDSILETFKIEAKQDDRKSVLIDVSDLFKGDTAGVGRFLGGSASPFGMGGGGMALDRQNTNITAVKAFPENIVIETTYNFAKGGARGSATDGVPGYPADPKSVIIKVTYNMFMLPETGYMPRVADKRVGYFTASYLDHTDQTSIDKNVNQILRWRLEKKDPNAAISEPVKPIVFWLDNAIPLEYRDAVTRGILVWNKALEKAGFRNAIVVNQMPDNADFDHSDMRYNVVRWVASPGSAYAVALMRANPITGEVVNASITVDANIVNFGHYEGNSLVAPSQLTAMFDKKPDLPSALACRLDGRMMQSARFGMNALEALSGAGFAFDRKNYVDTFVEHVVAHEMGHIMGLRHNFAGSTEKTLTDLSESGEVTANGISASVMDYVPFNVAAIKKVGVPFWTDLGKYDMWAIEYGYKPLGKASTKDEVPDLEKIASRTNEPGLAYQSDEMVGAFDPFVTPFDLSASPLDYYDRMGRLSRYLLMTLEERSPKQGESYWTFTRDWNTLFFGYFSSAAGAMSYIGGQRVSSNHKGDPGEKPVLQPISGAEQKRALKLVTESLFSEKAFAFPKSQFTKLTNNPNVGLIEGFMTGPEEGTVFDLFSALGRFGLQRVYSGFVLDRVANNEYKSPNALKMVDLFNEVQSQVWSELHAGKSINPVRRELQRDDLNILIDIVMDPKKNVPADAKLLAWSELKQLKAAIEKAPATYPDQYTGLHLAECAMRIDQALNAQRTIGGAAPSFNLGDLLNSMGRPAQKP